MPDKEVHTIQELIFFQYAKIITKSAMCGEGDLNSATSGGMFWTLTAHQPRQRIDFKPDKIKGG